MLDAPLLMVKKQKLKKAFFGMQKFWNVIFQKRSHRSLFFKSCQLLAH